MSEAAALAVQRIREATETLGIGAGLRAAATEAEAFPDEPAVQAAHAEIMLWSGRQEEGKALLEQLLEKHLDSAEVLGLWATWLAIQGDGEKALAIAQQAIAISPKSREAREGMLNALTVAGDPLGSLEIAKQIYNEEPHSPSAWSGLFYSYLCAGMDEEAERLFKKASSKVANSASFHVAKARLALKGFDMKGAERHARKAVEAGPESDSAWSTLATTLEFQGKQQQAEDAARKALAINPKEATALRTLANVSDDEQEASEARGNADTAMPFLNGDAGYFEVLDLITDDELPKALARAREVEREVTPSNAKNLRSTMFFLLRELEQWEELESRLTQLENTDEYDAECCIAAAALVRRTEGPKEAAWILQAGCAKWPTDPNLPAELLKAFVEANERDAYAQHFKQILSAPFPSPSHCSAVVNTLLDLDLLQDATAALGLGLQRFPEADDLQMLHFAIELSTSLEDAA